MDSTLQRPGIPVWVACTWPHRRPLRHGARWDGVVAAADSRSAAGATWYLLAGWLDELGDHIRGGPIG